METQEQTRVRLRSILDQIGPGMSLTVDDRFLAAAFGDEADQEADKFARDNHCSFRYESGNNRNDDVGIFLRAYTKKIDGDA